MEEAADEDDGGGGGGATTGVGEDKAEKRDVVEYVEKFT